jgi:hypothetical protein
MPSDNTIKELVRELFEMLDYTEESDGGKIFHPITITCCRVMMNERLNKLLTELKEASNVQSEA